MIKLFLNANDIPELTSFSGGIDADSLKPHVFTAQINDIKRILGAELYAKMYADYVAGTVTGVYKDILDNYIVPMEVYFACMYYMTFGGVKITNGGITRVSFDNGGSLSEGEVARLASVYRQLANNNEQFFINYIKTVEVPEYNRSSEDEYNNNPVIPWY